MGNKSDILNNLREYTADQIVEAIRGFANEIYNQKCNKTLLNVCDDFPSKAMIYNRNKRKEN